MSIDGLVESDAVSVGSSIIYTMSMFAVHCLYLYCSELFDMGVLYVCICLKCWSNKTHSSCNI